MLFGDCSPKKNYKTTCCFCCCCSAKCAALSNTRPLKRAVLGVLVHYTISCHGIVPLHKRAYEDLPNPYNLSCWVVSSKSSKDSQWLHQQGYQPWMHWSGFWRTQVAFTYSSKTAGLWNSREENCNGPPFCSGHRHFQIALAMILRVVFTQIMQGKNVFLVSEYTLGVV